MIVGYDATTVTGQLSGVGYYTSRLLASLANGAGRGVVDRLVVLSNRETLARASPRGSGSTRAGASRCARCGCSSCCPGILRRLRPDIVHYTNYLAPVRRRFLTWCSSTT